MERLPDSAYVFRLVPPEDERYFDSEEGLPHAICFDLSSADKRECPPRLSVFDVERTSLQEAKEIRGTNKHVIGFKLPVEGIRALRKDNNGLSRLDVVRDPLEVELPGADGHCGITGLKRRKGEERVSFKAIQWELRELCEPLD